MWTSLAHSIKKYEEFFVVTKIQKLKKKFYHEIGISKIFLYVYHEMEFSKIFYILFELKLWTIIYQKTL